MRSYNWIVRSYHDGRWTETEHLTRSEAIRIARMVGGTVWKLELVELYRSPAGPRFRLVRELTRIVKPRRAA